MGTSKHYIIYIPGFGGSSDGFRRLALKSWSIWGVKTEFVPMNWEYEKEFTPKLNRTIAAIQHAKKQGYAVSLIGESAGATIAINVGAKHTVSQILTVCGVDNPKMHIQPQNYKRAPAFKKAFMALPRSFETLDLLHVQTVTAIADMIINPKDSSIPGARNSRIFCVGHQLTIAMCLTILSGYIVKLIKS